MQHGLSESKFYMWRTLFALAHADNVITDEELRFMTEALEDEPFSFIQKDILKKDISHPQDIGEMFVKISDPEDQTAFFTFARKMVWIDGDYGKEEQEIMLKLQRSQIQNTDFDKIARADKSSLKLEGDDGVFLPEYDGPITWKERIHWFRQMLGG